MDKTTKQEEDSCRTSLDGFENRIKPINEKYMLFRGKLYSPCEVLREIYKLTDDPEIKLRCRIVSRMVKVMAGKISAIDGVNWENSCWPKKERVDETDKNSSSECKLR